MENIVESIEPFESIFEFLEIIIAKYGAYGFAAAMFAESAGIPFTSAIVLLTAGTLILRGTLSFWAILIASTIGITLGSVFSYFIGMIGNIVGKKVKANLFNTPMFDGNEEKKDRSRLFRLWKQYGNFSIFMAQLWGFSRTFISFPAGAMQMNFYLFTLYTFLGGLIFSLVSISSSLVLTQSMKIIIGYLRMITEISPWLLIIPGVAIICIAAYLWKRHVVKSKAESIANIIKDKDRENFSDDCF
jgi:membrane protein DedA with SNARE-associated domain